MAALVPAAVFAVTMTLPLAVAMGTFTLILVSLQLTYLVALLAPNLTRLVPRAAPKCQPVSVTVAPMRPRAGGETADDRDDRGAVQQYDGGAARVAGRHQIRSAVAVEVAGDDVRGLSARSRSRSWRRNRRPCPAIR